VKEDAISLYGFRTADEKIFFQLLISVSGIGPKLAKDILSNIQVKELASAIVRGDLARLSAVPGIGKKTAERLVLELKDKVQKLEFVGSSAGGEYLSPTPGIEEDVASALINLGYKEAVVRKALAELRVSPDDSMEQVLKQALKLLMK
jgi:Holliday junction DNA helicase RuvA